MGWPPTAAVDAVAEAVGGWYIVASTKEPTVDGPDSFIIGVKARCSDGVCGRVAQVVLDPVRDRVTHLIVEPEHRQGLGRLVPIESAVPRPDHVDLRCTLAEFDRLEIVEKVRFLPGIEGYMGYEPEDTLLWPYFGGNSNVPVVVNTLPLGEVAVHRGEQVHASDGRIGNVEGLVIAGVDHHVSHIVLKEGHLFGRKEVAIPITAVKSVDDEGVSLSITKQEVLDLPGVEFRRPDG
jgi:sporulation protein YlmC with PRC-barrel domain